MRWLPHSIYSRFSLLCLAGVVVLALAMGWTISSLLTDAVSEWEWQNTAALVTREVKRSGLEPIFSESQGADVRRRRGQELSAVLTTLPEVVRVKVWSREAEILWSDKAALIGQRFPGNAELRAALAGEIEVEIKRLDKSEQRYEARMFDTLAEVYVPVRDEGGRVVGVVEVDKTPDRLLATIRWSRFVIWTISLVGGAFLYAVLLPLLTQVYRRQVEEETLRRHARLEAQIEQRTQQFMQAQKMQAIGLLAGGIAHDFNNILTVISGRAQLLLTQLGRDAAARDNAASIAESAQRGAGLTRQLLTFSRKQILERRTLDVNAVIVDMSSMLQRLIGEHIRVVTALARDGAYVNADRAQLEQVLLNLAVNARDAMPGGGELHLATATIESPGERTGTVTLPAGRFVELVVRDTGSGMDEATRGRVFEPFFTTKAPGEGTGLGLSTVYAVVEQHDGHIVVESAPGQGATFRLYLPRVADPIPAVVPPASVPRVGCETILLVEDDDGVRELATRFLFAHGYTVLAAADGAQALEAADAHAGPIHVLLTDVVMPVWTGWQLAREFRARRPLARVLYMTGYAEMPETLDAPVLQKPFTAFALLQAVREVLDRIEPAPAVG